MLTVEKVALIEFGIGLAIVVARWAGRVIIFIRVGNSI